MTGLNDGSVSYMDRSYFYQELPSYLKDSIYIQTSYDDKNRTDAEFLAFDINAASTVYVAYYKWPYGKTNMVIDLIRFTAAHEQLQREVEKRQ